MAETNKSQLMSEAEIIEAINADSLISVSLGAGQPQKNVKMSTLASVAAGLMGHGGDYFKAKGTALGHADNLPNGCFLMKNAESGDGYPASWGVIVSFKTGDSQSIQFAFDASVPSEQRSISFRTQWDGVWSSWRNV